jgi:hypothetical protein
MAESDKRAESFRSEFRAELKTMQTKLDHIDNKLDIDRRMTIVEAKLRGPGKEKLNLFHRCGKNFATT